MPFLFTVVLVFFQLIFSTFKDNDIEPNSFMAVLYRGISYGGGFVYVGSLVAPKYQQAVAIFLVVVLAMLMGIGMFTAYLSGTFMDSIFENAVILLSAGYATYKVFNYEEIV